MLKKIFTLVLLSVLVSCGTHKPGIRTTKKSTVKTTRKANTRTTPRTSTASKRHNNKSNSTTEVLEATSKTTVYSDVVKQYVLDYKDIAKDNMRRHGIPASITLAQGILESGAGRGTLCVTANNHFGIKCHTGWTGESVRHDDDAAQECFRKYKDPAESYNDHSLFLTTRGRYSSLFKLDKDDYEAWAHGLKAAGYATDPKYPAKLIGIIERYELASYDAEVLGKSYSPKKVEDVPVTTETPQLASVNVGSDSYKVAQGDTLYSISRKYNLSVAELMKLNGLTSNAISIGQILKVK